jgi:UPF0271 protein
MGNMVNADPDMADRMARAMKAIDHDFIVFGMPDTEIIRAARKLGLRALTLFLADRAYDENANLVSRKLPNSVITSPEAVARRVKRFLDSGTVETIEGKSIKVEARSILVHSDTPGSVNLAATVRRVVEEGGGEVVPATALFA